MTLGGRFLQSIHMAFGKYEKYVHVLIPWLGDRMTTQGQGPDFRRILIFFFTKRSVLAYRRSLGLAGNRSSGICKVYK